MNIQKDIPLKPFNTFGIEANANYFVEVSSVDDLKELLSTSEWASVPKLILGGGSNILLTRDFQGLVVKMNIQGIRVLKEDHKHIWIQAGAGVIWHEFVLFCVDNQYAGIENLSLIPGTVGAAPMQNIGAYGVEIKDTFDSLEALELESGEIQRFDKDACRFGYRESFFKHEGKNRYIILNATFKLGKSPQLHTEYGAIQETLSAMGISDPSIKDVSNAVIQIRESKLPNPKEIGNAGSFFKNPEISKKHFEKLKSAYPSIPSYPIDENTVKVPAGWLIEQAGWKGSRFENIGVHAKQALVLVNYGGGKGNDIKELSQKIQASILDKFGIQLSAEVNFI